MAENKDDILVEKLRRSEEILVSLDCYQIVGNEHQSRVLALIKNTNGSFALFSFFLTNNPPTLLSDLSINSVFPIDGTFYPELRTSEDFASNCQFKILSGNSENLYYCYPDEATMIAKKEFDERITKITQEFEGGNDFAWLEYYRNNDMIDIELAFGIKSLNRETKLQEILEKRKPEYMTVEPYKIYCGTWNVNLSLPNINLDLSPWLAVGPDPPDLYAIGFQEIDMSPDTILWSEKRPDTAWIDKIQQGLHKGDKYYHVISVRLVGMMLTILAKESLRHKVRKVSQAMIGTGTLKFGNKGAVCASLQLNETLICFVNSHFAAHVQEIDKRKEDHDEIRNKVQFTDGFRVRSIEEHDQIYWIGDLNYRLDIADSQVKTFLEYDVLCFHDQLHKERKLKRVFDGFSEGKITFRPTYKYDPGTDEWDSSEKARAPAWCDRIFWKSHRQRIDQICYNSVMEIRQSDHKPVYAIFNSSILGRDDNKYKKVHEEVLKTMDKYENDNQPQLTVTETDLDFGILRFFERTSRELVVANNFHLPVTYRFKPKDERSNEVCEDWIEINHKKGELRTGESQSINIDINIDEKTVSKISKKFRDASSGGVVALDILVLHVENGRDIFITIFGEYKPSVFGFKFDTLMKLTKPIIEYSLSDLVAIDEDFNDIVPYNEQSKIVPREIWLLIDYLYKNGLKQKELFTLQRKHRKSPKICLIRDWLDSASMDDFPGTPQTAAEALLKLLESLPSPLVNIKERDLSIIAAYFEKCRDLLQNKLSPLNRKVFWYLIMFLKELRANYPCNLLDDRLIANIFGRALCRHMNEQYQQRFVLNFLQNDIKSYARNEFEN